MSFSIMKIKGFTLIELMIVMAIVVLLMAMVGPLAINSLEKAQAKQEMLMVKNWLRKLSYRAFNSGEVHILKLSGKRLELFIGENSSTPIITKSLESLFFQPQMLTYNAKGIVLPEKVVGTYRNQPLSLDLSSWVNHSNALIE